MKPRLGSLLVIALVAGSCSAGGSSGDSSTLPATTSIAVTVTTQPVTVVTTTVPPTTTSTSVAATTTVDPLATARAAFLAMESEWDAASTVVLEAHGDSGMVTWESQPAWCTDQSVVDEAWAGSVAAFAWPDELQAIADALVLALTARSGIFKECAMLPGSYIGQSPIFNRTDEAYLGLNAARDELRVGLRLPRIEYG